MKEKNTYHILIKVGFTNANKLNNFLFQLKKIASLILMENGALTTVNVVVDFVPFSMVFAGLNQP